MKNQQFFSFEQDLIGNYRELERSLLEEISNSSIYSPIIMSEPFERLKNISFLGAIDYVTNKKSKLKKVNKNRYTHSLNVAVLALYICKKRNYCEELTHNIVMAALLHDVGHGPLSHSVENLFNKKFGINHHQAGIDIIKGNSKFTKNKIFTEYLSKNFDVDFIVSLLNTKSNCKNEGRDLFSHKINIDTIDGIIRSKEYVGLKGCEMEKLALADAVFLNQQSEDQYPLMDRFWELKDNVYNLLILSNSGLVADAYSSYYFEKQENLKEEDFFDDEKIWKNKYKDLFDYLNEIELSQTHTPKSIASNIEYDYFSRDYKITVNEKNRYTIYKTKTKKILNF